MLDCSPTSLALIRLVTILPEHCSIMQGSSVLYVNTLVRTSEIGRIFLNRFSVIYKSHL